VSSIQSLDPKALHETAQGANMMLGEMYKRMLLMVRIMAETGFVNAFKKILRILVDNQDYERTVKLRGKWVTVKPSDWNPDFNVKPAVGLGHGTQTTRMAAANAVFERQMMFFQAQGNSLQGPFLYEDNVSEANELFEKSLNIGDSGKYFARAERGSTPQQEQQPDPEMEKVKGELELKRMEMQMKAQQQQQEAEIKLQVEQQKAQLEIEKMKAQVEIERWKASQEMQMKMMALGHKASIDETELEAEIAFEAQKIKLQQQNGDGNVRNPTNG